MDAARYGLTVGRVASQLTVSADTVRRWADSGVLPSYRLPSGHRRFERSAVQRFRENLLHGRLERAR